MIRYPKRYSLILFLSFVYASIVQHINATTTFLVTHSYYNQLIPMDKNDPVSFAFLFNMLVKEEAPTAQYLAKHKRQILILLQQVKVLNSMYVYNAHPQSYSDNISLFARDETLKLYIDPQKSQKLLHTMIFFLRLCNKIGDLYASDTIIALKYTEVFSSLRTQIQQSYTQYIRINTQDALQQKSEAVSSFLSEEPLVAFLTGDLEKSWIDAPFLKEALSRASGRYVMLILFYASHPLFFPGHYSFYLKQNANSAHSYITLTVTGDPKMLPVLNENLKHALASLDPIPVTSTEKQNSKTPSSMEKLSECLNQFVLLQPNSIKELP